MGAAASKRRQKKVAPAGTIVDPSVPKKLTKWDRNIRKEATAATLNIYSPPMADANVSETGGDVQLWRIPGRDWKGVGSTEVQDYYVKYPSLLTETVTQGVY